MKKSAPIIVMTIVLTIVLAGCGHNPRFTQQTINAYNSAISTIDDLTSYSITVEEAIEKLERIGDSISGSDDIFQDLASINIKIAATNIERLALDKRIDAIGTNKSSNLTSQDYDEIKNIRTGLKNSLEGK